MNYYSNVEVIKLLCIAVTITAVATFFAVVAQVPAVSVYNAPQKTDEDKVSELALGIYNSSEFEAEMRAAAMARALYTLSNEKSSQALKYAEMAQVSHNNSKKLAQQWLQSQ